MKRRHFLGLSLCSLFAPVAVERAAADDLPAIRSHTMTVPAKIEKSPQDGGERLFIMEGEKSFQFFYASHDTGRRLSPFPFELEAGKTYTFTIEERPVPSFARISDKEAKDQPEFYWSPVVIRVVDGGKTVFDMEICEVHHCRMAREEVPISYGLIRLQKGLPSLEEEKALFPHRRDYVLGGCIVMPGKKTETMYLCPECKAAYAVWQKAHPQPAE